MTVSDVGKLIFLSIITLGLFGMVWTGHTTFAEIDQWLGIIGGYLFGNGVNALRKTAPTSVIVPKLKDSEYVTYEGMHDAGNR